MLHYSPREKDDSFTFEFASEESTGQKSKKRLFSEEKLKNIDNYSLISIFRYLINNEGKEKIADE